MNFLKIIFVSIMIAPQLFSQTVSTQNTSSANDSIMQQFFSTCLPDESYRVVSGTSQVSTIPDPLPPQSRNTHTPKMGNDLRMVHWFHGLGGDINSWFKQSIAFSKTGDDRDVVAPRRLISDRNTDYSDVEDHDLKYVANDVGQRVYENSIGSELNEGPNNYDRSNSIAIAHSQGGIVIRKIDEQQSINPNVPIRFGGLVTITSPNQGAVILDPEQQEDAIQFLRDFGSNIATGPTAEILYSVAEQIIELLPSFLSLFFDLPGFPSAEMISNGLLKVFNEDLLTFYINETLPEITEDYRPGAEELDNINSYDANLTSILSISSERPLVTFVEEVELTSRGNYTVNEFPVPISWATINYFRFKATDESLFEADKIEHKTAVGMENTRLQFIAKKYDFEEKLDSLEIERLNLRIRRNNACGGLFGWLNPKCWELRDLVGKANRLIDGAESVIDGYQIGINELNNFNDNYLTAMGLRELDQTIEEEQYCICFSGTDLEETRTGPFPPGTACIPPSSNGPGGFGQQGFCYSIIEEVKTNNWTVLPSDGVLSVETQMSIPQATEDPVIISKDNPSDNWNWDEILSRVKYGSTHMAIRNDDIGKNALVKLFDGDFGLFFETDEVD